MFLGSRLLGDSHETHLNSELGMTATQKLPLAVTSPFAFVRLPARRSGPEPARPQYFLLLVFPLRFARGVGAKECLALHLPLSWGGPKKVHLVYSSS
jgi:hypothetical protein